MNHYADFLMKVIDSSSKTLFCSQEIHTFFKKMFGGKHFLDAYFERSPDKFFSNSEEELEVACHPEYLNNRKFTKTHQVEYAEKSDQLFNEVRKYFNIRSECTDGVDMVSLRKGTPAYELLLRKEKEQAERQKEAYAKGEGNFQPAAKTNLKKQGIECNDATKVQIILEAVKCAKGEGNFQLTVKMELKKRGIECDDATKAQSILDAEKCANREGNFQLAAKTELKKRGIECDDATKAQSILQSESVQREKKISSFTRQRKCDDPTKARSILNSINNPIKNPEFFAKHAASIKWGASNLSYKGDKWKKAEIEQLRKLCTAEYRITKIAETMNCEVASKRTVHNKIFELRIQVKIRGRFQLLTKKY